MAKQIPLVLAFAVCLTGLVVAEDKPAAQDVSAKEEGSPSLETIKKLAGDWVQIGEDGKPTDVVVSSIRVTAGGSAVREILFPDTDMEMVTIYTQESDGLFLTHYCILGNQPRLKAEGGTGDKKLVFKCVGGGNLDPAKDEHMGQGTLYILDDDHIRSEWVKCADGKACETHEFKLARKK